MHNTCPFCGKGEITMDYYEISGPHELGAIFVCKNCGASCMPENWNTRPLEDALRERAEATEKRVAELEALIVDACSQYSSDGKVELEQAELALVQMCGHGKDAMDKVAEMEARFRYIPRIDDNDHTFQPPQEEK